MPFFNLSILKEAYQFDSLSVKIQISYFQMNVKNKIIKDKEMEQKPKSRYNLNLKNSTHYESTPSILPPKELFHNKENSINQFNYNPQQSQSFYKPVDTQVLRSMEIPSKRLKTQNLFDDKAVFRKKKLQTEQSEALRESQQIFNFRQKHLTNRYESSNYKDQLTFGDVNRRQQRNGIMTSRDFEDQKRIKNQVIDEIITNAKRGLCKSLNELSLQGPGMCVNHNTKKAKYRLVSELSEGEQEMFYCSKCAINLLQQGFKVVNLSGDDEEQQINHIRTQQFSKFLLRLKSLQERAMIQVDYNQKKEDLQNLQKQIFNTDQRFTQLIDMLEQKRKQRLKVLEEEYLAKEQNQKLRREDLTDILSKMLDLQQEMRDFKQAKQFAAIKQNQFNFLTTSLTNRMNGFEETLQNVHPLSPKHSAPLLTTTYDSILEQLQNLLYEKMNSSSVRRSFKKPITTKDELQDFYCKEKKAFRILFPPDQMDSQCSQGAPEQSSMLNSVRQCPSFGPYQ